VMTAQSAMRNGDSGSSMSAASDIGTDCLDY
jgi:hypothetical protein